MHVYIGLNYSVSSLFTAKAHSYVTGYWTEICRTKKTKRCFFFFLNTHAI